MLLNTPLLKSSPFIFELIQAHFGQCFPEWAQKAVSPRWEAPSLEMGTLTHSLLFPPPFRVCSGFPSLPLFSLIKASPRYNFDGMVPLPGCPEGTGDKGWALKSPERRCKWLRELFWLGLVVINALKLWHDAAISQGQIRGYSTSSVPIQAFPLSLEATCWDF